MAKRALPPGWARARVEQVAPTGATQAKARAAARRVRGVSADDAIAWGRVVRLLLAHAQSKKSAVDVEKRHVPVPPRVHWRLLVDVDARGLSVADVLGVDGCAWRWPFVALPAPGSDRHFVYALRSTTGGLYRGYTTDLEKRWATHAAGKGGGHTRMHPPEALVYVETLRSKGEALSREYALKHDDAQKAELEQAIARAAPFDEPARVWLARVSRAARRPR